MNLDLSQHPCFNKDSRGKFGRIHLPIAPRCNIQCNYCNRKFDCVNESRPGVASNILSPTEALKYLDLVLQKKTNIKVVGIAGPGDPFANPEETMETLRLVRKNYPEMLLCVATNGLNLLPYIEELAELKVSHVTITLNTIRPDVIAKIYSWMRYDKRLRKSDLAAEEFLSRQFASIKKLKAHNVVTKVNTIILQGINDHLIEETAEAMGKLGVDMHNCIPFYKTPETVFADLDEPSHDVVKGLREKAAKHVPQMQHCQRCRADAVGMLGEELSQSIMDMMNEAKTCASDKKEEQKYIFTDSEEKPYIAVASREGLLVNLHLGEAEKVHIFVKDGNSCKFVETRVLPVKGGGDTRWERVSDILSDCQFLLVNNAGNKPKKIITDNNIKVIKAEGMINDIITRIMNNEPVNHLLNNKPLKCGSACSGKAVGCC